MFVTYYWFRFCVSSIGVYKRGDGGKTTKVRRIRREIYNRVADFMDTMELAWDGSLTHIWILICLSTSKRYCNTQWIAASKLQRLSFHDIVHFSVDCDICRCFISNDMFGWQINHSKRKLDSLDEELTEFKDFFKCLLSFAEDQGRYPIRTPDTGRVVLRKYSLAHEIFWIWCLVFVIWWCRIGVSSSGLW